ncbi:MAG: diguanylate cyclase [Acholeplasmataceae bacterium]
MQSFTNDKRLRKIIEDHSSISIILNSNINIYTYGINQNYQYLFFNKAYKELIEEKYGKKIIIGMNVMDGMKNLLDWDDIKICLDVALLGDSKKVIEEIGYEQKSYYETNYEPLFNENQDIIGAIVNTRDVTEIIELKNQIIYMKNHDYLTGLYNRRYLEKVYLGSNFEKYPLGLIMIDINGLKIINDTYGHLYGDSIIVMISEKLKKILHNNDIVARIGSDEFAILMINQDVMSMLEMKESILNILDNIQVEKIKVSVSVGFEIATSINQSMDEVLKLAENHLLRHKITVGMSVRNRTIRALMNTLTDKYLEEKLHSQRVGHFCKMIGLKLGLNKEDLDVLELAGLYHDIGKISIPDAIINKPGRLTKDEYEIIKTHTSIGYQILKAADEYSGLAEYALYHHERWDGQGYPRGLKGNEIPLFARIINVADSFEAMTADRPYRKGMSIENALTEINRCIETQFDPNLAEIFINMIKLEQLNQLDNIVDFGE